MAKGKAKGKAKKQHVARATAKRGKVPARKTSVKKPSVKKSPAKKSPVTKSPVVKRPSTRKSSRPTAVPPPFTPEPYGILPLIGAHVSSAGGSWETPARATDITAVCFQFFTKQANQWKERSVELDEVARFAVARAAHPTQAIVSHDSYLINLASPNPVLRRQSTESFVAELQRAHALGLTGVVSHPGNYMDDRASGLARNADAIAEALERAPGPAKLFLETTAGSGTALGATFEELAWIIEALPGSQRDRVAVCLDTCHAFSAGYDFVNDYEGVWRQFGDVIGFDRLGAMHLNDSKTPFNSHKDRHELVAEGSLGAEPFRRIVNDARLAQVPKMLETPKGDDMVSNDRRMLTLLRSYVTGGPAPI